MPFDISKNQQVSEDNFSDTVPDDYRSFYTKQESGEYSIDTQNPAVSSAIKLIGGMSHALESSRSEAKDLKSRSSVDLTPLKDFGSTPEEIASNVNKKFEEIKASAQSESSSDVTNQIQKATEALNQKHAQDMQSAQEQNKNLQGQLYNHLIVSEATKAIAEAKGDTELIMPLIKQNLTVQERDGRLVPVVLDGEGQPRFSGQTGALMTVQELVQTMKSNERYGKLFESSSPSGSGTSQRNTSNPPRQQAGNMSANQKIAAGLSKMAR